MSQNKINNPHDLFVKASLSDPAAAQEFALLYLPRDIVRRMDLASLQLTNKSYVSDSLKEYHNDLLFAFNVEEKPAYAYFLLENQSTPDYLMPLRFLEYNLLLLKDHLKDKPAREPWPILVNVCLYHNPNEKPYPYSTSIYDYMSDPVLAESIHMFTKFHLVDLNVIPNKVIESHTKIGLMETLLKYSRRRDTLEKVENMLRNSKVLLMEREDYWESVIVYLSNVIKEEGENQQKLVSLFKEVLSINEEDIMQTIAQKIEKEIKIRIRQEGKLEGRLEGEKLGIEKGEKQKSLAIAKSMLKKGYAVKDVAEVTGIPKEEIETLAK